MGRQSAGFIIGLVFLSCTLFIAKEILFSFILLLGTLYVLSKKITFEKIVKLVKRLWLFSALILLFHSFFIHDADAYFFGIPFSYDGVVIGLTMVFNLYVIVLLGVILKLRLGESGLIKGFETLGLSEELSKVVAHQLAALENEAGHGSGNGGGSGSGGGGGSRNQSKKTIYQLSKILKGDLNFLSESFKKKIHNAQHQYGVGDLASISAVGGMISAIRLVKIAPGLPVAPGHKNVLIIPLFIWVAKNVSSPKAGAKVGFISGVIHFFTGLGKYGPLGVLQFMIPGYVVDFMVRKENDPSLISLSIMGFFAGLSRVFIELVLAWVVGMEGSFYLVYSPYILSQCIFGAMSAPVSKYLLNNVKLEP